MLLRARSKNWFNKNTKWIALFSSSSSRAPIVEGTISGEAQRLKDSCSHDSWKYTALFHTVYCRCELCVNVLMRVSFVPQEDERNFAQTEAEEEDYGRKKLFVALLEDDRVVCLWGQAQAHYQTQFSVFFIITTIMGWSDYNICWGALETLLTSSPWPVRLAYSSSDCCWFMLNYLVVVMNSKSVIHNKS